jgi:LysR family glycine cleavage system transcriptional activator
MVAARRLPSLNGLKAFEAAARHGSFASAAAEMNVSPAAVSRLVHLLEDRLRIVLFERSANRLALTAAGRVYQTGLTPLFDAIANLTAQVTSGASARVLTVGVGPTFATRWLIPRLICLVAEHSWDRVRWAIEECAWRFDQCTRPSRPRRS